MITMDKFVRAIAWVCSFIALYDGIITHRYDMAAYDIGFAVWFYLISEEK